MSRFMDSETIAFSEMTLNQRVFYYYNRILMGHLLSRFHQIQHVSRYTEYEAYTNDITVSDMTGPIQRNSADRSPFNNCVSDYL